MALILNGTGVITGIASINDGIITSDDIASGSITAAKMAAGAVVQVVSTTKTDVYASTGGSNLWNAITGLSASITPSSSNNKILIMVNVNFSTDGSNYDIAFRIYKNGSVLDGATGAEEGSRGRISFGGASREFYEINNGGINYLDSPATTSTLTYDIRVKNQGTCYINREQNNDNNEWSHRGISTITLMEIKG